MQHLGHLEAGVMERLWAAEEAVSVRDVVDSLRRERSIAYTTVMTVLDNLHRKGMVSRAMDGRAYRYRPLRSREEHTAALMEQIFHSSNDRGATLLHFVEQMSPEEIIRLRAVLDQMPEPGSERS